MKDSILQWRLYTVRGLERVLSITILYHVLAVFAWMRAFRKTCFNTVAAQMSLPESIQPAVTRRSVRIRLRNVYLDQYLRCFQAQLGEPRWVERCPISGINHLEDARRTGKSVVLAFCHFGSYSNLRIWLRALGIPSAILVGAPSENKPRWQQLVDNRDPMPGHPTLIPLDQLRQASAILSAGIPLLIAVDGPRGKQMRVAFEPGWTFRMATGAMRMAVRHQAVLIPCCIVIRGQWQYRIELSAPVPSELLETQARWPEAASYLLSKFLPHVQADPAQCDRNFLNCFERTPNAKPLGSGSAFPADDSSEADTVGS